MPRIQMIATFMVLFFPFAAQSVEITKVRNNRVLIIKSGYPLTDYGIYQVIDKDGEEVGEIEVVKQHGDKAIGEVISGEVLQGHRLLLSDEEIAQRKVVGIRLSRFESRHLEILRQTPDKNHFVDINLSYFLSSIEDSGVETKTNAIGVQLRFEDSISDNWSGGLQVGFETGDVEFATSKLDLNGFSDVQLFTKKFFVLDKSTLHLGGTAFINIGKQDIETNSSENSINASSGGAAVEPIIGLEASHGKNYYGGAFRFRYNMTRKFRLNGVDILEVSNGHVAAFDLAYQWNFSRSRFGTVLTLANSMPAKSNDLLNSLETDETGETGIAFKSYYEFDESDANKYFVSFDMATNDFQVGEQDPKYFMTFLVGIRSSMGAEPSLFD